MELIAIQLEITDNIALLTINREKALNALNKQVMDELDFLFSDRLVNDNLFGVIIQGAGEKAFAAGADITEFMALDAQSGSALSAKGHRIFNQIEAFHIPVIAAVRGYALGAGCELAMACHMRIATTGSQFGQPEVKLGLIPGYAGTQRLSMLVGKSKAMEYTLTADMIDAIEAHRVGLVNHVVEDGTEVAKASEIIKKISKKGPKAISNAIRTINAYYDKNEDGAEMEVKIFGESLNSAECKEGVTAFLEKRKAKFR